MFNPRFEIPEKGNKFYNKPDNKAIYGKPTYSGLNVLSNCVGYANARFNEIIGEFKYQLVSNASAFKKYYVDSEYKLKISNIPSLGGIMIWSGGNSGCGHVAIVEEISLDKKTIITSESAYGGKPFYTTKRTNKNGRWGMNEKYQFIGCIINPYVNNDNNESGNEKIKYINYTIKKGDTLTSIAKKYNVKWHEIYIHNQKIIDSIAIKHGKCENLFNWIYPNTIIEIPINE